MSNAPIMTPSMNEFLRWVSERPRTYRQTMEAWRTSCPRLTVWEDAIMGGLVQVQPGERAADSMVTLTPSGRAALAGRSGA